MQVAKCKNRNVLGLVKKIYGDVQENFFHEVVIAGKGWLKDLLLTRNEKLFGTQDLETSVDVMEEERKD